jgi:GNAT superfamily N-acetyltransferase
MQQCNLRRATLEDIPTICRMVRDLHEQSNFSQYAYDEERVLTTVTALTKLNVGQGVMLLAEVGGEPAGVLSATKTYSPTSLEPLAMEIFWWVDPAHRNSRAGLLLIEAFEYWGRKIDASALVIGLHENKYADRLRRLYNRKGYTLQESQYIKEIY